MGWEANWKESQRSILPLSKLESIWAHLNKYGRFTLGGGLIAILDIRFVMQKKALNLSRSHQTVFKNTKSKVEYQANFGDSSGAIFYDVIFIGFSLVIVYCFRMWKEDDLAILCTAYSMIGVIVEWEIDHNFYALRRRTIELRAEDTRASRAILVWLTLSSENSVQSQDRNRSYWWNFSQSSYCFPATNHCTQGCLIVK